jgi:hypothetical protein
MSIAPKPTRISLTRFRDSYPVSRDFLREKVVSIGLDSGDILMAISREDKLLCYYFTDIGAFQACETNDPELLKTIEDLGPPEEDGMTHFVYAYVGVDCPGTPQFNYLHHKRVYITKAEADLVNAWNEKSPYEQENGL